MKKSLLYIVILIAGLGGCRAADITSTADPTTPTLQSATAAVTPEATATALTAASTATPAPTAAPTPTPSIVQSDSPFLAADFGDVIGMQIALDDADSLFGQPQNMWGMIQGADGETYLWVEYDSATLALSGISEELAQGGENIADAMTADDRAAELYVEQLIVKNEIPGFGGVAGLTVGSSRDDVWGSFLNLWDQYEDGDTLYTISDINAQWQSDWTDSFVGGRILDGSGAVIWVYSGDTFTQLNVECDEVIEYTYVDDSQEYPLTGPGQWNTYGSVQFYMKDGMVTAINLYRFTDPE